MRSLFLLFTLFLSLAMSGQNTSLNFDGSTERVAIPAKEDFNLRDGYTMEAWIYAESWKSLQWQGSILTQDGQGPDRGFALRCGDSGKLSFVASVAGTWVEAVTPSLMNEQQWHHVAVVISNGTMKLYIDGSENASVAYSDDFTNNNTLPLTIGASAGFGDRHFDGRIDEIRIWHVARTQTELSDNIATSFTGSEAGLVAYFPMNEGSGTSISNLVDASCTGSLVAMDDSNWSDGYAIPDFDIAMLPITSIDVVNMKSRPVKMSVDVKNNGTQTIVGEQIELVVSVDGTQVISEKISEDIASGEVFSYEFDSPLDLTETSNPSIEVVANYTNDQNMLNNAKTLNLLTTSGSTIRLFDARQHNFGAAGQSQFNTVRMPGDLSEYIQLLLHIDLDCPGGGCDPWDQPAKVTAVTSQGSFEIARYVTPYGIACGPWTVDVTDFKDVLTGPVTFQSYIQVWGQSGWLLTLDLELIDQGAGIASPYSKLTPLWQTDYQVYGDPEISYDLAEVNVDVAANTETSHIRMTNSGHGQGNTQNAAEFSQMTHTFTANGATLNQHELWNDDCAENTCANQAGTWLFPRAGWCPGQEVKPYTVNTTEVATAGSAIAFDYELQEYTNLLNTGYNDSGHTEPHYRIWSYFIEESSTRYNDYNNIEVISIQPEISGDGESEILEKVTVVIRNTGSTNQDAFNVSYFLNGQGVSNVAFMEDLMPGQEKTVEFTSIDGYNPGGTNIFYGVSYSPNDDNIGDDVAKFVKEGASSIDDILVGEPIFSLLPNPSTIGITDVSIDLEYIGSQIQVFSASGEEVNRTILTETSATLYLQTAGIYMVAITTPSGYRQIQKLIVH